MKYLLPFLLFLLFLPAPSPPPEVRWTDGRHAILSWEQDADAEVCVVRLAHQNYILLLCDRFAAGPQRLNLPPFASGNDRDVWPAEGDVYRVGIEESAPLGPPPIPLYLPLIRR